MERLPGFRDFYPEPLPHSDVWSADARQYIFAKWRGTARRYCFHEYDGPPLEPTELFTTKSGEEIIGQLYNFTDKGERAVALRPEMTPTLARMISAHERNYKKPVKWFAIPQLFRYERQQKGRLREHFQLNADIIGESDLAADAELIALAIDILCSFGLTQEDFVVRISHRGAWQRVFEKVGIPEDKRYEAFQAIDKADREPIDKIEAKFAALGLSKEAIQTIMEMAEGKGSVDIPETARVWEVLGDYQKFCKIDYKIVRGLAYYTGIVFEIHDSNGEFRAIAGGGRYDNLVKLISGGKVDLPALGFGMGDVVLLELLTARGLLPKFYSSLDAFVLIDDEKLRAQSISLIRELRRAGFAVEYSLTPAKVDKQFKRAQELKAAKTVRLESADYVRIRDLKTREEVVAGVADTANHLPHSG
jgi:histidyl-tRNA synthetase